MTVSAACLFVANTFMIMALRTGEIAVVAPFRYAPVPLSRCCSASCGGATFPMRSRFIGIVLVLAAGLYTLHRERAGLRAPPVPVAATGAPPNEAQSHEGEDRPRRAGARLLGDVSLAADRRDAGLCRLRLGADRLRARQHRPGRRRADGDGCDAVGITPIGRPKTNAPSDITEPDGPRRDGRAGAARQHGRGCPLAPWRP